MTGLLCQFVLINQFRPGCIRKLRDQSRQPEPGMTGTVRCSCPPLAILDHLRLVLFLDRASAGRADAYNRLRLASRPVQVFPLDLERRVTVRARNLENPLVTLVVPLDDQRHTFVGRCRADHDLAVGEGQRPHFGQLDRIAFLRDFHAVHLIAEDEAGRVPTQVTRRMRRQHLERATAPQRALGERVAAIKPANLHDPVQDRRGPEVRVDIVNDDSACVVIGRDHQNDRPRIVCSNRANRGGKAQRISCAGCFLHSHALDCLVTDRVQNPPLELPRTEPAR